MVILQLLLIVGVVYGPYCIFSFLLSVLFRKFIVLPIFAHAKVSNEVNTWKDALWWGFYHLWEYLLAVLLLIPYQIFFFLFFLFFRIDLAKIKFWNEKEQRFFASTPKQLLQEWISKYFQKYYSTDPQK